MRRGTSNAMGAAMLALLSLLLMATPVAAECTYIPPFPAADDAIRSADEVLIGDIVAVTDVADLGLGPEHRRDIALRVTEVLRGPRAVGDLVDVQYLEPNWPWTNGSGYDPFPSCSYLGFFVDEGDTIALALGAVQPRQRLEENGEAWIQPRTVYNAMSKVRTSSRLADVRYLAGLPPTDLAPPIDSAAPRTDPGFPWLLMVVGVIAGAITWRRTGAWPQRRG
jgi:hypothetical protein